MYFFRPSRNTRLELSSLPPFILVVSLLLTGPQVTTMDSVTNSLRFLDNITRSVSPAIFSEVERKKHKRQRGLWANRQRKEKGRDEEKISRGTVTM